eukprot:1099045-Pyramimonas_sp.AAC.1
MCIRDSSWRATEGLILPSPSLRTLWVYKTLFVCSSPYFRKSALQHDSGRRPNEVERWEGITNKALYLMPDTTDDFFATMNTSGTKIFSEKLLFQCVPSEIHTKTRRKRVPRKCEDPFELRSLGMQFYGCMAIQFYTEDYILFAATLQSEAGFIWPYGTEVSGAHVLDIIDYDIQP